MNAAGIRLRQALEEYVQSIAGDTGSRRSGGIRRQVNGTDRKLVDQANALLEAIGGSPAASDTSSRDTPGSRARDRVSTGGRSMESARDTARALLGAASATNGPAGTPAGGGNTQGGQS